MLGSEEDGGLFLLSCLSHLPPSPASACPLFVRVSFQWLTLTLTPHPAPLTLTLLTNTNSSPHGQAL